MSTSDVQPSDSMDGFSMPEKQEPDDSVIELAKIVREILTYLVKPSWTDYNKHIEIIKQLNNLIEPVHHG